MGPEEDSIETLLVDVRKTIKENQLFLEMLREENQTSTNQFLEEDDPEQLIDEFEEL